MDNLRAGVSYTTAFGDNLGKVELEYQTPIRGLALTAEASLGNHGYDDLLSGVRYYFGSNKSLRDRQRQDDPPRLHATGAARARPVWGGIQPEVQCVFAVTRGLRWILWKFWWLWFGYYNRNIYTTHKSVPLRLNGMHSLSGDEASNFASDRGVVGALGLAAPFGSSPRPVKSKREASRSASLPLK